MTACLTGPGCGLCFTRRGPRPLTPAHWRTLLGPVRAYEGNQDVRTWRGREQRA